MHFAVKFFRLNLFPPYSIILMHLIRAQDTMYSCNLKEDLRCKKSHSVPL